MTSPRAYDSITEQDLRSIGGLKWSSFPEATGAFVAEMDFGVAPPIHDAIESAVAKGLFGYLPPALGAAMSQACADWQSAHYGWELPVANIRPLPDVLKGLEMTIEHFTEPGSAIVLPTPAYMPFLTIPAMLGRRIIEVPMLHQDGQWTMDYDGLDAACADGGGMIIFCNPHNPIGKVYSREEMTRLAELVDRHQVRVFADEIHAPLVYPGAHHVPYASISEVTAGHTVTSVSASKAWNLPGLKCAQIILSNEADLARWDQVGMIAEHGASNLGVVANTAAFTEGEPWLDGVREYLDGNRRLLAELIDEHLPGVHYDLPQGTYLAWLDCRELGLAPNPAGFFLEHAQVACTDGALCGQVGTGFARFTFAMPGPVMVQAITRMGAAVRSQAH
ncbi:MalY/PatB family protein [Psychromicrobium xiongbiense]|uniref:MalY/PatB family protein n=1 Tax=Psychromicrobium xiongbiense TaxID=3051184 RepID=UPI0025527BF3|nr:aminotransferase class I/II-fold pyridoxal phosphate-dependent enzyme [Psychromicrobium sp. YIM S02556]